MRGGTVFPALAAGAVAAVGARFHGPFQVPAEGLVVLGDALNGVFDAALHGDAGALGGAARPARAAPQADGARELGGDEVELGLRLLGAAGVAVRFGLRERLAQVLDADGDPRR